MMQRYNIPIYPVINLRRPDQDGEGGIPSHKRTTVFETIETACSAVKAMVDYSEYR